MKLLQKVGKFFKCRHRACSSFAVGENWPWDAVLKQLCHSQRLIGSESSSVSTTKNYISQRPRLCPFSLSTNVTFKGMKEHTVPAYNYRPVSAGAVTSLPPPCDIWPTSDTHARRAAWLVVMGNVTSYGHYLAGEASTAAGARVLVASRRRVLTEWPSARTVLKLAFHDADTDTDTDILARVVAKMSACRSVCHRNYFRKSRGLDVSARILAEDVRVGVGVVECQLNFVVRSATDTVGRMSRGKEVFFSASIKLITSNGIEKTEEYQNINQVDFQNLLYPRITTKNATI